MVETYKLQSLQLSHLCVVFRQSSTFLAQGSFLYHSAGKNHKLQYSRQLAICLPEPTDLPKKINGVSLYNAVHLGCFDAGNMVL